MTALEALVISRKYTDDTAEGMGAVKGKNAIVSSIQDVHGGHNVTFAWYLDDGTYLTETMFVADGAGIEDKIEIINEAVAKAEQEIVAQASEDYNTLEKIESILKGVKTKVDGFIPLTDSEVDEVFNEE